MSKKLQERIDDLERRVRDLEARPIYVPIIVNPAPPALPNPWYQPWPTYPTITCGEIGSSSSGLLIS